MKIVAKYFWLFVLTTEVFAQASKTPDIVVLANIKKESVILRWAPANQNWWKLANTNGYRIERVPFDQYMESAHDSLKYKNAVTISSALKPLSQNDERWKTLLAKNKKAAFLFGSLYSSDSKSSAQKKEMAFALLMKSCDLDHELALAAGLILTDSTARNGEAYVYRVSINNIPPSQKFIPAVVAANTKEISSWPSITSLKAKFGDRRAVLTFVTLGVKEYSGYWIERSDDSVHYTHVNQVPFIRATTKHDQNKPESTIGDSLPQNDKKYFYRVIGINCFGETGPSSNVVSGMGKPAFKEFPVLDSTVIVRNSSVQLYFHVPEKLDKSLLKYFLILRSDKRNAAFQSIASQLATNTLNYTDTSPMESNYYKVAAVNKYGDTAFSFTSYAKLIDETPPAIPSLLTGTIDSNGVIKLLWTANTEKDFLGYRVYRCNSKNEQPVELTKKLLIQPTFKDSVTLQTLTREVYYTVRAVDKVYNNSGYSEYCKLIRPDKISPVAIVFNKVNPNDTGIYLSWFNSSSNDVKKYVLYRREKPGAWQLVAEWNSESKKTFYSDNSLTVDKYYQYKLVAVDESGNSSSTESPNVLYKPLFYPKIGLKPVVDRGKRLIELQWIYNNNSIYNFTLYKAKGDGPLQVFKMIDAKSGYFIDKELYPNNKYRYAIKATLKSGAETKLSDVVEVEF